MLSTTCRGVKADAVQPEWCRLNEGQCYWKDDSDNPMFWQLETPLTTPLNLQGYVSYRRKINGKS